MQRALLLPQLLLLLGVLTLTNVGCERAPDASPKATYDTWDMLARSDFQLVSRNGGQLSGNRQPTLSFHRDNRVSGSICNRFTGHGYVVNDHLILTGLIFSSMLCADSELNALETEFGAALRQGARITLQNDQLHLWGDGIDLVYIRKWSKSAKP
ncbi:META domain-containing protein [Nitratidesulfovibrio termitidis]|uniref:META domain-containing protein n=1 Tax=Nitratidesulfovibrio termitidis TaxID=42252 RepID=UPI000401016C|nr:META domain-containing protein [Nitratidesulfovibrio termitidis]